MIRCLISFALLASLAGCGGDGLNRVPVEGTVKVNGVDLAFGSITFFPAPGTNCKQVAGEILNGNFAIAKKDGPIPGQWLVKISAPKLPDGKVPAGKQEQMKLKIEGVETIPEAYNSRTILKAEVKRDGENSPFEFNLKVTSN